MIDDDTMLLDFKWQGRLMGASIKNMADAEKVRLETEKVIRNLLISIGLEKTAEMYEAILERCR